MEPPPSHPTRKRTRAPAPADVPRLQIYDNIWCISSSNGRSRCLQPPEPATQLAFDATWWVYYKDEPFISMPDAQWTAVGQYLRQWAQDHAFTYAKLRRSKPTTTIDQLAGRP